MYQPLADLLRPQSLDEVFGLIETIEKAAEIYMKICDKKIVQSISNENLIELAPPPTLSITTLSL